MQVELFPILANSSAHPCVHNSLNTPFWFSSGMTTHYTYRYHSFQTLGRLFNP